MTELLQFLCVYGKILLQETITKGNFIMEKKIINYNEQPTLLIGLGGFGSKIVDNISGRVKDKENISTFSIDTDIYIAKNLSNIPQNHIISIAQQQPLHNCLDYLADARDWFPNNPLLFHKTLSKGAGQVRAVSRLAYELSLKERRFDVLLAEVDKMAEKCVENSCRMRISIVSTLVGGTASGIFIQVALLIREHLGKYFPTLNAKIQGEFILPATFISLNNVPMVERRNLECNAYAALKELNAINEHYFSNAAPLYLNYGYSSDSESKNPVDALPYDYCFLYDRVNLGSNFNNQYIEDAIIERLFSNSANELNDVFVENLRLNIRKNSGNLYGTIYTENLPLGAAITDSEIFRSTINRTLTDIGKHIILLRSPRTLNIDTALFPKNTIFIEKIDVSATEIHITDFCFGLELCTMEKFKFESGLYHTSYQNLISRLPVAITPHLNKNWHIELKDIGNDTDVEETSNSSAPPITKPSTDNFVFISYSSHEIEIANQLKHILETNGVSCWMAPQSIPAGSDYGNEIPKAIEKCKVFLLLLSDASQNSNWVPKEVGLAIGKGKIVVPFQIDNTTISEAFNFYLTNSQRISAYNRMTEAYQELLNRLKDILN